MAMSPATRAGAELLWAAMWKQRRLALGAGFLLAFSTSLRLPMPLATRYIIDRLLLGNPINAAARLDLVAGALAAALLLQIGLTFTTGWWFALFSERVIGALKRSLMQVLLAAQPSQLRDRGAGYLQARILADVESLNALMAATGMRLARDLCTLVAGVGMLFYLEPYLALISLAAVLPFAVWQQRLGRRIRGLATRSQEAHAQLRGTTQELLASLIPLQALGLEPVADARMAAAVAAVIKARLRYQRLSLAINVAIGLGMSSGPLIALWYAGHEILAGRLTLGTWIAFNTFLVFTFAPVGTLLNLHVTIQTALASLKRVGEIHRLEPQADHYGHQPWPEPTGPAVRIRDLVFGYEKDSEVLRGVSLEIDHGETVAIVGPSGCGKSTLAALLVGLHRPTSGMITIHGVPLQQIHLGEIRAHIDLAVQEALVLSGSLAENIALGCPAASAPELREAARMTGAEAIDVELRERGTGVIEERGRNLSGGQRQRIALARAALRDRDILILDEATAHLDATSEEQVRESLLAARRGKTTILIAHRLANLCAVDRVVFMERGKIRGDGTHQELVASLPAYAELVRSYSTIA